MSDKIDGTYSGVRWKFTKGLLFKQPDGDYVSCIDYQKMAAELASYKESWQDAELQWGNFSRARSEVITNWFALAAEVRRLRRIEEAAKVVRAAYQANKFSDDHMMALIEALKTPNPKLTGAKRPVRNEMTSEVERVVICLDVEHCDCGDAGFYVVPDGDGEPMQEQCRFCYTTPWSVFNVMAIQYAYAHRNDKTETVIEPVPF